MNQLPEKRSFLIGLFIVWQLYFVLFTNVGHFIPRQQSVPPATPEIIDTYSTRGAFTDLPPLQKISDLNLAMCQRYEELTGQIQGWSLFAPEFGKNSSFLAITIVHKDGNSSQIKSDFEPEDTNNYFRWRLSDYRRMYREAMHAMCYWFWTPEEQLENPEKHRLNIIGYVQTYQRSMLAYALWVHQSHFPNSEEQVDYFIIQARVYPTAAIGKKVTDQHVINQPIARIYPRGGRVEYFDTVADSFKPLP